MYKIKYESWYKNTSYQCIQFSWMKDFYIQLTTEWVEFNIEKEVLSKMNIKEIIG